MPNQKNKVQFNLKNVHYALLTEIVTNGVTSYELATPVHVPGAVTLTLDAQSELSPFYADGIVYYQSVSQNGYQGDLEMAKFPDQMLQDVWGFSIGGTSKVLTENVGVEPKAFALLFQIDGDVDHELYVMYNCKGTKPSIASETNTDQKTPHTQTSTISATPLENGNVQARTTADTPTATKNAWYDSVFVEGAGGAGLSSLTIGQLTLTPSFSTNVTEYTAATTNASDVITAAADDADATIAIKNGSTTVTNGNAASWSAGPNTVKVTVTKGTVEKVYTVTVTKS